MTTMNIFRVNGHPDAQAIMCSAKLIACPTSIWCSKETKARGNR